MPTEIKKPYRVEYGIRTGWRWYGTYATLESAQRAFNEYWWPKDAAGRVLDRRTGTVMAKK